MQIHRNLSKDQEGGGTHYFREFGLDVDMADDLKLQKMESE